MRTNLALLTLMLSSMAFAQLEIGEPLSNGVLSLIEDLPAIGNVDEGVRRSLPFVEVIDTDALEVCRDEGFDSEDCPEFEYSVPFIRHDNATAVEEAIVDEWLRFETRSYYRTQLEIGALSGVVHCTTGLGVIDLMWLFYTGDLFFPAADFCDDFPFQILPNCFLQCDIPLAFCPAVPVLCPSCVTSGVATATARKYTTYYLEYNERVAEAILSNMPLAIMWEGPTFLTQGSMFAPVLGAEFPAELLEVVSRASEDDPRALAYYLQGGAVSPERCMPGMPRAILDLLRTLPGETRGPLPGNPALELHKRTLADRESAGSTYGRFPFFWLGQENIYPRYRRAGAEYTIPDDPAAYGYDPDRVPEPILGPDGEVIGYPDVIENEAGELIEIPYDDRPVPFLPFPEDVVAFTPGEDAVDSATLPLWQACFGYATLFHVYQELDVIVQAYRPIQRLARCYIFPFGSAPTPFPVMPIPWEFSGYRFHTDWTAVPEGYDIPHASGTPIYFDINTGGGE